MVHVLYNPASDNNKGLENAKEVEKHISKSVVYTNVLEIKDMPEFLRNLAPSDEVIVTGGDGTLNHFVNDIDEEEVKNSVFYFPTGTGNDFMKDVENYKQDGMIRINEYIRKLPTVSVNGLNRKFINGIGYGIDGYCCEEGDRLREKSNKPINYASIAIKGTLYAYKATDAVVTVDGEKHTYKNVWLAPTMNGRYYGGGMEIAPAQDRLNEERTLSCVILHHWSRLKTLVVFPSIFKGEHVSHKKMVDVLRGKEITVEFNRPTALQIDGETVKDVTSYTVRSFALSKKEDTQNAESSI